MRLAAQLLGLDNLRHSCQVKTSGTTASSTEEIISLIGSSIVKSMIPEVVSLIKFYLVCPATSASAERSFSQSTSSIEDVSERYHVAETPQLSVGVVNVHQ